MMTKYLFYGHSILFYIIVIIIRMLIALKSQSKTSIDILQQLDA